MSQSIEVYHSMRHALQRMALYAKRLAKDMLAVARYEAVVHLSIVRSKIEVCFGMARQKALGHTQKTLYRNAGMA